MVVKSNHHSFQQMEDDRRARRARTDFPHLALRFASCLYAPRRSLTIASPGEETVRPHQPTYHRPVVEHLGLGAGLCDARGSGDVSAHARRHHPAMRDLPVGEAVTALGRKGVGWIPHARARVPRVCPPQPPARRMAPRVPPAPLPDAALGRAWETRSADGVTALYRRLAGSAATRLGLWPTATPRDTPRVPGAGRSHRDEAPAAPVVPITTGSHREQRPDRHHVLVAVRVAPQAGSPLLMPPRRGPRREPHTCGQALRAPLAPVHPGSGAPAVVAARALDRADTRAPRAQTVRTGRTRVPATVCAAHAVRAHAAPPAMAALPEGARAHAWTSTDGGVAPRGVRRAAAPRRGPAPRPRDTPRRRPRAQEVNACTTGCRPTCACDAEA